jgi:hypothetical protein
MKISEVLAISGKPGLFKVIASSSKNLVVESMVDGKRTSVPGSVRVSSLADITMYTTKDDVPLRTILLDMHKKTKGESAPSHASSPQEVKDFVDSVISDLDHDRIYVSDLKKLVQWFNILISVKALPFEEEEKSSDSDDDKKTDIVKKSAAKKPKAKNTSARKPTTKKTVVKKAGAKKA